MAGKAIPELQQAVRANPKDSEALGALGQAYSQKGDRANAVANLEKALALDPHSSNNDKWNSLLKVNRYWLAIQQGDAALKANNPDRAERLFQQARNVDNTDSYAVLGLGDVAMARKDYPAAERYYQQTLRMDSGNTNAVRGLANIYRQQSPEKAEAFIASLSASQRRSIDDIERSLQNDRLAQQAEALENPGKWAQAAALQRQRLALDPGSVWITYRLSQDLWQAGQRSQADTLMRNLAQQKSNDPEQVYAYGLYLSGHDQTERRWRISTACRVRSGTAIFRSWLIDCKAIRCWKPLTACEKAAKRQKRKRCCASNHLPRVLTSRWLTGRNNDVITPPPALHIRMS